MTAENPVLIQAIKCAQAGLSVIPVHAGEKRPALNSWKQYQQAPASLEQVIAWYTQHPEWGLGIACGQVSGNLEMLELEGRAAHLEEQIIDLAENSGLGDLVGHVFYEGWTETTPTGGIHYYYRLKTPVEGNQRLAQTPNREVLAETRGEGGYVVIAPTDGTHHPTGNGWEARSHGPERILTLTPEEHTSLLELFKAQNQYFPPKPNPAPTQHADGTVDGTKPGDDFETKTSWEQILTPHGWVTVTTIGNITYWRRPGKNTGISATTGHANDRNRLYVFSTSTAFEPETPYTKFGAYALLNHGGNHAEAAKQLAKDGYGTGGYLIVNAIPGFDKLKTITETEQDSLGQETPDNVTPLHHEEPATRGNLALVPNSETIQTSPEGSEDYYALLYATAYQHLVAYCSEWGRWLRWNGFMWQPQDTESLKLRELAKQLFRQLPAETKTDFNQKKQRLSRSGITNVLDMAKSDPRLDVPRDKEGKLLLDKNLLELNTPLGIVDLTTGEMFPSRPSSWHTKSTTVAPVDFPTPMWDKFLTQTFNGDQQMIDYLQRLMGYSATGVVEDHVLPFLFGPGGNGKSVIIEVLMSLLGDYATTTPAKFLMAGPEKHETELARLNGKRLVICSEINENDRFDEAKIKLLTGGDRITARFLYQDYFTFQPTHKLWLAGNHKPKVETGGGGFWRRIALIGCTHKVPKDQMITNLSKQLVEKEGSGILYWITQGAKKYFEQGLGTPQSVIKASQEYEKEEDTIARFVEEYLIIGGGEYARVTSAAMNNVYRQWCYRENENEMNSTNLGRVLRDNYGLGKARSNRGSLFTNVTLANLKDDDENSAWDDLGGGR